MEGHCVWLLKSSLGIKRNILEFIRETAPPIFFGEFQVEITKYTINTMNKSSFCVVIFCFSKIRNASYKASGKNNVYLDLELDLSASFFHT